MNKIRAILTKEWLELRRERSLIATMLVMPLVFSVLPAVAMFLLRNVPDEDAGDLGMVLADPTLAGFNSTELGQVIIGRQFGLLLLLLPVLLPGIIAAYSIVGEKNNRTLEPLLATPISTWQLLFAKCLAAFVPALSLTWLAAAIFSAGVWYSAGSPQIIAAVVSASWLLLVLLGGPLLGLISIALSVAVSSRVSDPRTAQQITGVLVVPFLLLVFGQLFGVVVLNVALVLVCCAILALLAGAALWAAVRIFQRETILTRWR
jgi:ABC-2 type transport system permease protein